MIRYLLAAALAVACTPAPAQSGPEAMQAKIRGMTITIFFEPCPEALLMTINPEYQAGFRRATVKERDKTFAACWRMMDGQIVLVDELGNAGGTPPEAYGAAEGV
jgi:hypothetical protein